MASAFTKFSEHEKQATASCRALITSIDRVGLSSQVRSRERPSVVLVRFKVPGEASYGDKAYVGLKGLTEQRQALLRLVRVGGCVILVLKYLE
jgi:hypothetical protein